MQSYAEFIKKLPIFTDLSPEEAESVGQLTIVRKYRKNMIIFMEGEPGEALYFLLSGKVKISKLVEDGREQILHILQAGDIFAEVVLIDRGSYPATAEVIEEAQVGMLRNDDVENLIRTNPDIALKILKVMSQRLRQAQIQVRDLALRDTYGRLASMLLILAKDHGCSGDNGVKIDLSLSRQELANLIGTSRETVTRILSDFKRSKVIDIDKQEIVIVDEKKLKSWM